MLLFIKFLNTTNLLQTFFYSLLTQPNYNAMKLFSTFCIALFLLTSCGSSEKKFDSQSYEQHKESLAEKEKKNPLAFLRVAGDDKKNIIGQTVVRGKISNKATISSYKDVRIKMLCYKDNKVVVEHEDVIDDMIKPNSTDNFKIKYRLPKGTDSIALSVMSADVAE
jgi:hypothetical protein